MNLEPPVPNLPLLRSVLAQIDQHPEQWDQTWWFTPTENCGTAACIAGWTCLLSGDQPTTTGVLHGWRRGGWYGYVETPDGQTVHASERAQELLRITTAEARHLFEARNSRHDIQLIAETIAHDAGERL